MDLIPIELLIKFMLILIDLYLSFHDLSFMEQGERKKMRKIIIN